MKKGGFSVFPPIPPLGACSVGRLFAFSHTEGCFRPLGWDTSKSVPHKPCFSVIYVGRCLHFSHRNGQNRGLMWELSEIRDPGRLHRGFEGVHGLAGTGGSLWERRSAPRCARYDRYDELAFPCCAPLHRIAGTVCTKACLYRLLFRGKPVDRRIE